MKGATICDADSEISLRGLLYMEDRAGKTKSRSAMLQPRWSHRHRQVVRGYQHGGHDG
jgi:hypothetical protein